ncbi:MAG: amidase, partial [Chloroflexi bacterium]|nr:amidase [Chloroflexota bacterium]
MTAREAVRRLAAREVSPLELIDAAVERIAEVDGAVNALPTLAVERAREHAARLTASGPPADAPPGYLHGLPFAVKDLKDVAGVRSTKGSPIYAEHVPERSDYLVENIEAKGGVVLAKSNTPEFGAGANTFNEVFGKTHNPWDTRTTCGGSSGGAAVALATGQVWLATGSDLGGSLRIPASFCSVVGLRPSPGRVPHGPKELPFAGLSVEGPMGRTVGDVALFLDTQASGVQA